MLLSRPPRRPLSTPAIAACLGLLALVSPGLALGSDAAHGDPSAHVVLGLAILLVVAKLAGEVATRAGQAAVLGELIGGVLLGNVDLFGVTVFESLATDAGIDLMARIGVLVLLFEVGIESTVGQMLKVGWAALRVATLGVIAPFVLGWAVARFLAPDAGTYSHIFVGATLTATSVGITARVLKDLRQGASPEARVVLGAAVIDDVLGLVILAVVTGLIAGAATGTQLSGLDVGLIFGKSIGFLVGSLVLGVLISRRVYNLAAKLKSDGVLLALSLSFCFILAWAADAIGLASIVGAFAAGLILEDVHYEGFVGKGEHRLEDLLRPISTFVVPIFFVVMGLRTDLRAFADPSVLGLAGALTFVAILGKQACALGVSGSAGMDRLAIGIGMIPRGEVGLIFANIGLGLSVGGHRIVDDHTFAAIVVMVIVTTMITPPLLKWKLGEGPLPVVSQPPRPH